jgi:hypothetical protein
MTAINRLAQQIFSNYDANRDGVIQLRAGAHNESSYTERETLSTSPYFDEIIVSKVSQEGLFKAADVNGDMKVTLDEIKAVLATFDTNKDGELKNSGPFWNRKGEMRNFENSFPVNREVIYRHTLPKPFPQQPFPGHPGGIPHIPNPQLPGGFPRAYASTAVGISVS